MIILDDLEKLLIPKDLEQELQKIPNARDYFLTLSRSGKLNISQWLVTAKRPETRHKRISKIVAPAAQNLKPKAIQWT